MASATATFEYKVRDRAGKIKTGTLDAETSTQVATKLKSMGYAPVSITQANTGMSKEITIPGFGKKKVKLKDLAIFSRQFATMINAGLSMLRSLSILAEQTESKELARVIAEVRNDVETGSSLSAAMGKHPDCFPPLFVNMTKAGEVGGFLDSVLLQVAENYEAEVKLRGKVKAALTYPVVVFVLAILMAIIMLIFIVPVFAKMFESLGAELPLPTRVLVFLSGALRTLLPVLIVLGIAGKFVWGKYKRAPQVRNVLDPLKFKVPVFGMLFRKIAIARFTRNLGTMMRSGVPILQALDIVGQTTGNVVLERAVQSVMESVRTGEAISQPLAEHDVFPPMVVQMMSVGEDTGALDDMLLKIAQFYDQEVEATTEALTALIEPLMIAFLGGMVGGMIVALYMPIFKVFDLIQ